MASDSGIPNRLRIGYYRGQMEKLGYEAKFFITGIIGKGTVEPHKEEIRINEDYFKSSLDMVALIRPKLSGAYQRLTDEELIIDGIFLVARKVTRSNSLPGFVPAGKPAYVDVFR